MGQKVDIDTRAGGGGSNTGIVKGHVSRVDPTSVNGTVTVEVLFDEDAAAGSPRRSERRRRHRDRAPRQRAVRAAPGIRSGREHGRSLQARPRRQDRVASEREARPRAR